MSWEYETIQFAANPQGDININHFQNELSRMGWDGWELVSVAGNSHLTGITKCWLAVFKRPLTEERKAEMIRGASNPVV